jgi:hypothetical protein
MALGMVGFRCMSFSPPLFVFLYLSPSPLSFFLLFLLSPSLSLSLLPLPPNLSIGSRIELLCCFMLQPSWSLCQLLWCLPSSKTEPFSSASAQTATTMFVVVPLIRYRNVSFSFPLVPLTLSFSHSLLLSLFILTLSHSISHFHSFFLSPHSLFFFCFFFSSSCLYLNDLFYLI